MKARNVFDALYDVSKYPIFFLTQKNPEIAHSMFVFLCNSMHTTRLDSFVLDNSSNKNFLPFELSNAAGFVKNAEIHPSVLRYLGFDRVVVGTVTYEPYAGNPKPRCYRFIWERSIVNQIGLENKGAEFVAKKISRYKSDMPLTINIAPTPEKSLEDSLKDLEKTVSLFEKEKSIDRFELNISCPSIPGLIKENIENLEGMIKVVKNFSSKEIYIKVSPNLKGEEIDRILQASSSVNGFTLTNTTTSYASYVPLKSGLGGASGDAVYSSSLNMQQIFYSKIKDTDLKIIACGGISSVENVRERVNYGATGIQIYTPLIFSGTKLLRKIRESIINYI